MSLINDALRKARKDAAEQTGAARKRGPSPRNRSFPFLGVFLIACLAAGLGGILSWFLFSKIEPVTVSAREHDGFRSGKGTPTPMNPDPADLPQALPPAVSSPTPTEIPKDEQPSHSPTRESSPLPLSSPTPLPSATGMIGKNIFSASATIEGHRIELDYLVFREEHPFAQINGITIEEGAAIEGFLLKKVEKDRILLKKGDTLYTVRAFE